ncbi:MAG: ion transporter [Alphaproteobacteria bacterium]|nr:MAG: ion transporter [Alphaproteobacteria bacterium]
MTPRSAAAERARLRRRVLAILDGRDRQFGNSVVLSMQALIVLAAASFAVSTLPELPGSLRRALRWLDFGIAGIFAIEYGLRLWAARSRLGYALSFWGIVDLCAWLPVLITESPAATSLRILRLLQVLRILKILRYNRALRRLVLAFRSARDELTIFAVVALFLLYLSAVGIWFFEHRVQPETFGSVPEAFWWAVITLTTVGYGDAVPVTVGGRVFTMIVILIGMGVFAVPAGVIASALISRDIREIETEIEELEEEIHEEREGEPAAAEAAPAAEREEALPLDGGAESATSGKQGEKGDKP